MKNYQPANYRITVEGYLDESWSDRVGAMTINTTHHAEKGALTTLAGRVRDQAELFGLLNTLYELHLPLISVKNIPADQSS